MPVAKQIESGTYLLYDGSCGTGGMLTVAEQTLKDLAADHGKDVSIHLFGQEISDETYAICKADLLLKGEGDEAENIFGGADKSTLSADQFRSREFDFMISNPPYGKSWKTDLERMGGKKEFSDPRFIVNHDGDPEFKLITRSSDGQLMFLVNKLQKMKHIRHWAAVSRWSITDRPYLPAMRARARAMFAAGFLKTTGLKRLSRCLLASSITPALPLISGCWPIGRGNTVEAKSN